MSGDVNDPKRGMRCNCLCHSSDHYKHIMACCCLHRYIGYCPICSADPKGEGA